MNKYILKIITAVAVLITLNSCGQNTKKQNTMSTNYRDTIKNNYKSVKMFDYNPTYQIRFENYDCYLEFYINDVLVVYLGGKGKSAGEQHIDFPEYILKSGIQTFRVKIYPLLDKNKKFEKFVSREAQLKVRVVYGDYRRELSNWDNFKEVFKVELPKIETNVPFLEFKREFTATVPYELEGWSNGVDLSKEDPKELEQEVLERMNEIASFYRDKDIEGLAREHHIRVKEFDQAYYFNTKENSASWESEITEALNESKSIEVLSGEMKLMANGKLVTILVSDGAFKNKSIIRSDVGQYYDFYPQYFYRPSKGAKLQVIR
ncbi:hypothetical protein [Flavobacterium muglaense]|uniref:Uncharacterized protein n=1 Tax=Flavobacterium muglaense TaxID=2764716 RepID=A0A923SJ73_9FLAO|nr:hypothetical protein [Flavobacterium muglaense]MBC5837475.1 hypothetical protein [Flavobacterium muglaense]MBC5844003.1 hypothetical protein [Flavobacterium muglaense]